MRGNHMVAVCDILGFSDLVASNSLDAVVDGAIGWFRKALNHSVRKGEFPSVVPATVDLDEHQFVGVAWFSDTVLFYTKEDTDEAVRELLICLGWLLFETIVAGKTRVRAGVAYGEVEIDRINSLYVGKPIVEAYELEQDQQWSGAALAPSACARVPEYARSGEFADWWVTPWDVPLKRQRVLPTLAVNWNWGIHSPGWRLNWSKSSESPTAEDWEKMPSICEKFGHTKRFHAAHCRYCGRQGATIAPALTRKGGA